MCEYLVICLSKEVILANSNTTEYETSGKMHLNALFWIRSSSSRKYFGRGLWNTGQA